MIQLIKVAEVKAAVQWPASSSQTPRLPLDHLHVAEERVENLPNENDGTQEKVGDSDPQNPWAQTIGQLQAVSSAFVFGLQTPLVLEKRSGTPEEDQLKIVLQAARVENRVAQQR